MRYIRKMRDTKLTLEVESMDAIPWRIKRSYGIYPDLKVRYGGMMSLGKYQAAIKSSRHRINSRSTTELKIIVFNNHITGAIWTLRFLRGQGIKINKDIVYQHNQSAIFMERNGKYFVERKHIILTCSTFS